MSYTATDRRNDFEFFKENYDLLYQKYGHKFIVIQFKKILGVYNSEIEAMNATTPLYPLGTFIVQECNGCESGYTNYISSWQLINI